MTKPEDIVAQSAREWEERARSEFRDFYIASHPGWDDPQSWKRQAEVDVSLLLSKTPFDAAGCVGSRQIAELTVLEIGCGIGRLAEAIAPRVSGYTGVDISPTMIDVARSKCIAGARFFVNGGDSLPDACADTEYDLVFASGVFIHCQKDVCQGLLRSALGVMARGSQLRAQFLADPRDTGGYTVQEPANGGGAAEANNNGTVPAEQHELFGHVSPAVLGLITGTIYKGHEFGFDELRETVDRIGFGRAIIWRFDPTHMYLVAEKA